MARSSFAQPPHGGTQELHLLLEMCAAAARQQVHPHAQPLPERQSAVEFLRYQPVGFLARQS
jgi:hypothetical protein